VSIHILGLNSAYHESSACIVRDGELIAGAAEERFTRKKHAKPALVSNPDELPVHAIEYCLATAGIDLAQVDHIGFSLSPDLRLERNRGAGNAGDSWGSEAGEVEFHRRLISVPDKATGSGLSPRSTTPIRSGSCGRGCRSTSASRSTTPAR